MEWPLGFWDRKVWLDYDEWMVILKEVYNKNKNISNFVKNVRKFLWKNRVYRMEEFCVGQKRTRTLVGDFDAPFPEFLKTEKNEG